MPHLGYNQPSAWPEQGEIHGEFDKLVQQKDIPDPQRHFISPTRPFEELYDCEVDPDNLTNLVDSQAHKDILATMCSPLFASTSYQVKIVDLYRKLNYGRWLEMAHRTHSDMRLPSSLQTRRFVQTNSSSVTCCAIGLLTPGIGA